MRAKDFGTPLVFICFISRMVLLVRDTSGEVELERTLPQETCGVLGRAALNLQ